MATEDATPTEVSDVVAAAASEPTELAGVADLDTTASEAWSLCNEEPEPRRLRPWFITGAALAVSLAVVGVAVWVAVPHLRGAEPPPVAAPTTTTQTTTQTTVAAPPLPPPPPPTVTTVIVQAPPPVTQTPAAPQWVSIYDQQLFNRLTAQGLTIPDYGQMARDAHLVCAHLANGQSPYGVKQEYAAASGGSMVIGEIFVSTVMATYPSCP